MQSSPKGTQIKCESCDGKGIIARYLDGSPDECRDCAGNGTNWCYPSGVVARYYAGPLNGRVVHA